MQAKTPVQTEPPAALIVLGVRGQGVATTGLGYHRL